MNGGRQRNVWQRELEAERKDMGYNRKEIVAMAHCRIKWIDVLYIIMIIHRFRYWADLTKSSSSLDLVQFSTFTQSFSPPVDLPIVPCVHYVHSDDKSTPFLFLLLLLCNGRPYTTSTNVNSSGPLGGV